MPSMNDSIEARLEALGLALPATEGESYYGAADGTMKSFHITGSVLHLAGHVPVRNGCPCTRDASARWCPSSRGWRRRSGPQ